MDAKSVDISSMTPPSDVVGCVSESVAREYVVLPYSIDSEVLTLVVPDDIEPDMLDNVRFVLNREIRIVVAPRSDVLSAIDRSDW